MFRIGALTLATADNLAVDPVAGARNISRSILFQEPLRNRGGAFLRFFDAGRSALDSFIESQVVGCS